jgi:hypothetical protein
MGRNRKPPPLPRDPFDAWGDVPTDQRGERKRLARIVARNGRGIANYRAFCRELGGACHEASWALYERIRIHPSAVVAELEKFRETMAAARQALASPAFDLKEILNEQVASERYDPPEDSPWRQIEPRRLDLFPPSWEERAAWTGRELAYHEHVAAKALGAIDRPSHDRRPDDVTQDLVRCLIELWRAQTGCTQTLTTNPYTLKKRGDFLEFREEVITPIWRGRELQPPSIEAFVRDYCYPLVKDKIRPKKRPFNP